MTKTFLKQCLAQEARQKYGSASMPGYFYFMTLRSTQPSPTCVHDMG